MIGRLVRKGLFRFSGRLPCRIISDGEQPYLERYFLFRSLGVTVYLHRFVGSDPDRGLHDHPWPWAFSLVMAGRYLERRRGGDRIVRWFNRLSGDTFHRVVMLPQAPSVWTLFVHSNARVKPWGFWHETPGNGGEIDKAVWQPHMSSTPRQWWTQAPPGREVGARQPIHR